MRNNVLDYLDEAVLKNPDKAAFIDKKESLTFRQLKDNADRGATYLHNEGYYNEGILIYMSKSPSEISAFFTVIRSGNYYVPIDEKMPAARINLIIQTVNPRLVICDETTIDKAANLEGEHKCILFKDVIAAEADNVVLTTIRNAAIDVDPIYIVFTSGSTGVPKGVCACHRNVIDYIESLCEALKFDENTVFGNQTPLYFDSPLKEIYPTLKYCATTYLVPKELFMFPVKLVEYLNENKINTICWVVSALTMISGLKAFDTIKPEHLRLVAFGSEVFPIKQFNMWKEAAPNARFVNLYGPTEGTGMCCYYEVDRDFAEGDVIPIGRPFKNTGLMLIDEEGKLANEGEIVLRGSCVTLGYFNNEEKTNEVYTLNPLISAYKEIVYHTGDVARRGDDGNLYFISRKDYQIKHMGHRIELGEIEAAVNALEAITICACTYNKEKEKINLFYVGDIDKVAVLNHLKDSLPRYMIPNRVEKLDRMPLTDNGKIDRKGLASM